GGVGAGGTRVLPLVLHEQGLRVEAEHVGVLADVEHPERAAGQGVDVVPLEGFQVGEVDPGRRGHVLDGRASRFALVPQAVAEAGHGPDPQRRWASRKRAERERNSTWLSRRDSEWPSSSLTMYSTGTPRV